MLRQEEKNRAKPLQPVYQWQKRDYGMAALVALIAIFTILDLCRRAYKFYKVTKAFAQEEAEIKEEQVQAFKEQKALEEKEDALKSGGEDNGSETQPKQPEQKKND